ncbi:sorting nexin-2 [Goodea atripinnis]|uniref:Sorting nexin-2 n=1 Tax=Goodea atripinnis TaxID=208336 RepID=A0ABV0PC22_9TELE
MLGNSEDHTALSRALSQLAEVEEKIDQLHQDQANADLYLFSELLGDYVRLICAVKGVFDQRMKTWQKWQDSQMLLQKKREAEAKLQFTNKPDKLQQAKDEIKEGFALTFNYTGNPFPVKSALYSVRSLMFHSLCPTHDKQESLKVLY